MIELFKNDDLVSLESFNSSLMNINSILLTDETVLAHIGSRVRDLRLQRNITQNELAQECGVGKSTVERFERGASIQLTSLIRILRILGKLDGLLELVPDQTNPIQMLTQEKRVKYRARKKKPRSS